MFLLPRAIMFSIFYSFANMLKFLRHCPFITVAKETFSLSSKQWPLSTSTPGLLSAENPFNHGVVMPGLHALQQLFSVFLINYSS